MSSPSPGRPAWQRGRLFQFFASVKLAVVLLLVIIVASVAGTIWESRFDAKVARTYVYDAPWFNIWLLVLVANLTVSAISRWPWRKHHVGFLTTHLGIIVLLFGSLIGRIWGVEGTITLFKGDPPSNRLLIDERQLRVRDTDGVVKGYKAEFIHRKPTPERPRDLGPLASGARLSIIDYAPAVEGKLNPRPLPEGGSPAVRFTVTTQQMGQQMQGWLLADDAHEGHGTFTMGGLASIDFKRGRAPVDEAAATAGTPNESSPPANTPPAPAAAGELELEESIFAFTRAPDQQVGRVAKGGSTGAKVVLSQPAGDSKGEVTVTLGERSWTKEVATHLGREVPLEGSSFTLQIEGFWPDFRIDGGKPVSVSDQPNNPAVVVTLRGRGVPAAPPASDPHATPGAAPAAEGGAPNKLTLFIADDGALTYELHSRRSGRSTGTIALNQPLQTGWADWTLTLEQLMPNADHWLEFAPVTETRPDLPAGVRIRVQQRDGTTIEQWIPGGWQVSVPMQPVPLSVSYGWRQYGLPIALELLDFEVERNEGSDSPAGFKSTVRVTDREGRSVVGQCWMNNPFSHPSHWTATWSGLTYKMSQASWNPENLGQSTIQILRDPGWLLKWIGSLLICLGIYFLFYVKSFRRQSSSKPVAAAKPEPAATAPLPPELVGAEK
jgi:hypothetical protein